MGAERDVGLNRRGHKGGTASDSMRTLRRHSSLARTLSLLARGEQAIHVPTAIRAGHRNCVFQAMLSLLRLQRPTIDQTEKARPLAPGIEGLACKTRHQSTASSATSRLSSATQGRTTCQPGTNSPRTCYTKPTSERRPARGFKSESRAIARYERPRPLRPPRKRRPRGAPPAALRLGSTAARMS